MQPYAPVIDAFSGAPVAVPERREIPFKFSGTASEYFRIWIVNTLLTIVTLGIYSAWAKVRNKQYFYRHTSLDGASFEYLAKPIAILKGRIIAAVALGLLAWSQYYSLTLYIVMALLFFAVTPWVLVKALAFNARNSAYRNIRFAFTGRTGQAAGLYFGMLLLYVVTCALGYPYAEWRLTSFVVWRHLYGDLPFQWRSKVGGYYKAYLIALVLILPVYIALVATLGKLAQSGDREGMQRALFIAVVPLTVYFLIPQALLRARIANLLYGGIQIGDHVLVSKQRGLELLKLYITNLFAIVVSFGLLIPWAKIRLAAYRASTLSLIASGGLYAEKLLEDDPSALGQGLTDLGDFDLGIGT